jgi:SAM-dependent methyltransferase
MTVAQRVSAYNRERKWRLFVSHLHPIESTTILDVGFSDREYSPVDNYLEKRYPWPARITALGIDTPVEFPVRYPEVSVVQYSGGRMPFDDGAFDVAWSNAVLEHVGRHDAQVSFVRELMRVSGAIFLTTPNRFFPIETHTRLPLVHWCPARVFDAAARAAGKGWAAGGYMNLLGKSALRNVLSDAGADGQVICNRVGPFTLDFVVVAGGGGGRR